MVAHKTATGSTVKQIGPGYRINSLPGERLFLAEIDGDHWKTWLHQRLAAPLDKPGALTFFDGSADQHLALAKHLTAEEKSEIFIAGKGTVTKWTRLRRQNHWLDALYYACTAAHPAGARLLTEQPTEPPPPRRPRSVVPSPLDVFDGRNPWIDFERIQEMNRRLWG